MLHAPRCLLHRRDEPFHYACCMVHVGVWCVLHVVPSRLSMPIRPWIDSNCTKFAVCDVIAPKLIVPAALKRAPYNIRLVQHATGHLRCEWD